MKRVLKIIVLTLAVGFVVLQVFQIDKANQPVNAVERLEAVVNVPVDVQMVLDRSCADCHSNVTRYPWYSYVQPIGWFTKGHIDDGKRHLNFSTFGTLDTRRREKKLEEICEQVSSAEMPLPSYLWIHRDAALSDSDRQTICDWTKTASEARP